MKSIVPLIFALLCSMAAYGGDDRLGVQTHYGHKGWEPLSTLDAVKELGVGWIRDDLLWGQVETEKGRYPWNVIAFGPGHGIQLRGGRLILPFWCALGHKTPNGHPRAYDHHPSFCGALWSDDHGDTWDGVAVVACNTP